MRSPTVIRKTITSGKWTALATCFLLLPSFSAGAAGNVVRAATCVPTMPASPVRVTSLPPHQS